MKCPRCRVENNDDSKFCSRCGSPLESGGPGPTASFTRTLEMPAVALKKDVVIAGKYRIIEELGRGGMGIVYKAEDLRLKRSVALKFLPPHLADSPELKERFLVEAQAAAALNHPNICTIHEVGESEDRPYIAMEFVEGETLREKLKKGPLMDEEALDIAAQVAAGLGEAHHAGIVHRDVKSANIMVTSKGRAKVMDFGLAKLRGGASLTRTQTTLGTVAYMSPEQARGGDLDGRTDIWSLGVVLFEMLAGRLPFRGAHDQTVIYSILHGEPESLRRACPGLKPELDRVVGQALVKDRARRYPTMEDLLNDLKVVAEGLGPLKARRRVGIRIGKKLFGSKAAIAIPAAVLAAILIFLGLNALGVRDRIFGAPDGAEPGIRLAVLPFANLTGDPAQEYLSDGLTQEMISQLGRIQPRSLSVIARTSVMRYKNTAAPIDQIGRELGVDYVIEGSVGREAGRLRVAAALVHVNDQAQIWADTFERELAGVLAVQAQVAQSVARSLSVRLLPAEQARLVAARTVNPEAYEAVLKGYSHWQRVNAADFDAAQRLFESAIEKDPSYAPSYAGLAWVWLARRQMSLVPYSDASKVRDLAKQALELDEGSAEAHEVLASYLTWSEWDWAGAEPEWKRTLELNPNNANAHAYYAHFLAHRGKAAEGIKHSERAIRLDPFNALYHALSAVVLHYLGRPDDALAAAKTAIGIDPRLGIAHSQFQRYYIIKGLREEQLADQRMRIAKDPERLAAFDSGLAAGGYEGAQRGIAEVLAARYARSEYESAHGVALRYLDAGDKDKTIEWLYKAFEDHNQNIPYLGLPEWAPLRDDPRFQALMRRLGLPLPGGKGKRR